MIVTDAVSNYLDRVRLPPDPVLAEMEEHGRQDGIPIVMPGTGALLEVMAMAKGAQRALEVGTAIGVSTLHILRGMAADGTIVSFEIDPERHRAARDYLGRAGVLDRADLRLVDAREGLTELEGPFDFAFIDGVKSEYGAYFDRLFPLLGDGAVLVVDNVLMGGSVADDANSDRAERARKFNDQLLGHPELTGTVTPVGDGVLVAVRGRAAA
jgi:caffeoyl-CoA O-methyltransferase